MCLRRQVQPAFLVRLEEDWSRRDSLKSPSLETKNCHLLCTYYVEAPSWVLLYMSSFHTTTL